MPILFLFSGRLKNLTICLLLAILTGCQTPPLQVYSSTVLPINPLKHQTFSIQALVDSENDAIQLINQGISNVLTSKGYRHAEKGDFVVLYQIDIIEDKQLKSEPIPVKGLIYTRTTLEAVYEAKILINVVDASTNEVLWKAASTRDLRTVDTSKFNLEKANLRMAELFESFPSR